MRQHGTCDSTLAIAQLQQGRTSEGILGLEAALGHLSGVRKDFANETQAIQANLSSAYQRSGQLEMALAMLE